MRVRTFVGALCVLILSQVVSRQKLWAGEPGAVPVKVIMHQLFDRILNLREVLLSDAKFSEPKNLKKTESSIAEVLGQLKQIDKKKVFESPAMRVTFETLEEHLKTSQEKIKNKDYEQARLMLASTPSLCISCHTQLPQDRQVDMVVKKIGKATTQKALKNEADFLFTIRRFDDAEKAYEKIVQAYADDNLNVADLDQVLRRQMQVMARLKRDPKGAVRVLGLALKNEKLPLMIRRNVEAWLEQFKAWDQEQDPDLKKIKLEAVATWAESKLKESLNDRAITGSDPHFVNYLRVSGILFQALNQKAKDTERVNLLYWLGIAEKHLQSGFYFPISDLYFRECMHLGKRNPVAQKCYKEYEASLMMGYRVNDRESDVPVEVQTQLKGLRELVGLAEEAGK